MASTEIQTLEQKTDGAQLMALFLECAQREDFDAGKMRAIYDMKRDWDRDRAAEVYAAALTTFQAKCPTIVKKRVAKITGQRASYSYQFASYDDIMDQIGPLLTECGLVVSYSTENQDKGIRVTLKIRHGTHVEPHTLDVPIPAMSVNDTQRYGAALQYAKRYALCAALNIVTAQEDDDGESLNEVVTENQANEIDCYINDHGLNRQKILDWLGVNRIDDIPANRFDEVMAAMRQRVRVNGQ